MNSQTRTTVYIGAVAIGAAVSAAVAGWLWPIPHYTPAAWTLVAILALVVLAGAFPIKLSRQADASLLVVPLFMAVLLLHPTEAILIAAAGSIISELYLKAPKRAIAFNSGVNSLAAGAAGIVFVTLKPDTALISVSIAHMIPALAAAITLLVTNILLVDLMVTVRKGFSFWTQWKDLFVFETIQEGGLMPVGLLGAILFAQAWWAPVIVIVPAALAYYGFHHSVTEAAQKAQLADRLQNSLNELREMQAQLINSAKMASVGSLATGIAHEINNPVFAISGRADLLMKGAQKHLGSQKAVDYVNDISEMALRISNITNHLMAYAQNSGEDETVFLNEVMESSITLLGNKTKRVRILRDYQDIPVVDAVPSRLQQVFLNLITNAIDASPEWASISVGCSVTDEYAIAYIKDEGVGISEEVQERLFEPFVTSNKDVDNRVGMGLGMYTCHRVVDALSGTIAVDSTLGKGTTITVKIPISAQSQYNWDDDDEFMDEEFESLAGN